MKKNHALAASALAAAMLMAAPVSCLTADKSTIAEPSPVIFEAQINEYLPTYRFELSKQAHEEADPSEKSRFTLSIYDPTADTDEPKGRLIQDFSFKTGVTDMANPTLLIDVNFDGSLDLVIYTVRGAGSTEQFEFYLWHERYDFNNTQGFLMTPDMVCSGFELGIYNDGTNQLFVSEQLTAEQMSRTLYQVEKVNGYQRSLIRMLRRELSTYNVQTEKTEHTVSELIDGNWVTIYSDDGSADNGTSENFLRFGTAEPISIEQAYWLAGRYNGWYTELRQLRTIGGKTYYEFYTCDPVNSSDYEYCGVAADGSEIIVLSEAEE